MDLFAKDFLLNISENLFIIYNILFDISNIILDIDHMYYYLRTPSKNKFRCKWKSNNVEIKAVLAHPAPSNGYVRTFQDFY